MLVFEAAGDAPFALVDVDAKPQLPFEDLLVVAGRLAPVAGASADAPRQFTGVGGRVRADGKRRLAVFPLPSVAVGMAGDPCVQVLDVGEAAALFLQDTRACFPSLIKKSPLALAADSDDSDSESDSGEDGESDGEPQRKQRRKSEAAAQIGEPAPPPIDAETLAYMGRTRVKVLPTLDEFFRAYQVASAADVAAALARDRIIAADSQVLCLEFPPSTSPLPQAVTSGETKLNFGVLFCHATAGGRHAALLHVPLPRSVRLSDQATGGQEEDECFQDATVLSFGTHRESTRHGGGKSSAEMVQNIRMRHASGTFCTLVLPTTDWPRVADKHQHALPQVRGLHGELRLRRILGPAPNGEPVELQLEA
jgi:hypothetical protein